jgi:ribonuclease HII
LRDSKLLTEGERERLFGPVGCWCAAWSVGHTSAAECDEHGMTAALRMASARAFAALPGELVPDAVVLDGNFDYVTPPAAPDLFSPPHPLPGWAPTVRTVVRADRTCASVAAASVLAKVTRDRQMRGIADSFPAFDFDRNKGYPSPSHKVALRGYGLTALHRRSWAFVDHLPWGERYRRVGLDELEEPGDYDGETDRDEWAGDFDTESFDLDPVSVDTG